MTDDDVEAMHWPLRRETTEPTEGREPPPRWLWALVAVTLVAGGVYFTLHYGGFSPLPHVGFRRDTAQPATRPELARAASGEEIYRTRCAACHQPDGRGLPPVYPPLLSSEWVVAPPEIPVRIVLLGLTGPLEVAGEIYSGQMPGWAEQLTDAEIARVVSYVRELSGVEPVDAAVVARERAAMAGMPSPLPTATLLQMVEATR